MTLHLPQIIGHRGIKAHAPENTLAGVRKAAKMGLQMVEFDVMLTADAEAIIIHDEKLNRTTNGKGKVADTNYVDIKQLDAGIKFSKEYAGEKVPTFIELIACLKECGLAANIEIKASAGYELETAEKTVQIIHKHWPDELPAPLVSSFSFTSLKTARSMDQDLHLGLLLSQWHEDWQQHAEELNCVSVHVNWRKLTAERVQAIKQAGYLALAYTVNKASLAEQLFSWGVDAIFSDGLVSSRHD